jgi:23S rRNA (guanosine2251-2'-O)-methyltransferase
MRELIIALDDIRSHHNVGSIFRSADAFGVKEIILGGISPCPPHRDIQKTALGATESVPWRQELDLLSELQALKSKGIKLIAVEQTEHSVPLTEFNPLDESYCVVLGNEVNGVSSAILDICDKCIEIKQVGIKKSLNVSVCAGIVIFHLKNGL